MTSAAWAETDDGITLALRVTPRSSRESIGPGTDMFVVRLRAPPVDGAANKALVAFLAKSFGVAKRDVTLLSGETGRLKRVAVSGDTQALASVAASLYGSE